MSDQPNQIAHRSEADDLSLIMPNAQPSFWSSIKPVDERSQSLLFSAREGESRQLADLINQEIVVENLLIHPVTLVRDNGEAIQVVRIVMIAPNGDCVSTCSNGVQQSIRTLCQIYGLPPWPGGRRFRVRQLVLKSARRTFKLDPVVIPTEPKGKTK